MRPETMMKTARNGAFILMIPVAAELVYYTYSALSRSIAFCFTNPDRWNKHWRVDDGTIIELGPRIGYFAFWLFVILASVVAFVVGLYILNRCRRGFVFDVKTAQGLRILGGVLAFAMVIDQVFQSMSAYLITRFNEAGPEPIKWFYDPSDFKTFSLAIILYLFGWVMLKGIEVANENKGYV